MATLATAWISTLSELIQLNTTTRQGAVILPSTFLAPGRTLTFKDTAGSLFRNPLTFSTITSAQLFEDTQIRQRRNDVLGSYTFTAGADNRWYITGGTTMPTASISSLIAINTSSIFLSSGNTTLSTLKLTDRSFGGSQDLYMRSTFMMFGSTNIPWAGTRVASGPSFVLRPQSQFLPNQVVSNNLWLDAADLNSIQLAPLSTPTLVSRWFDKSGQNNHATPIQTGPAYLRSVLNGQGGLSFGFSNSMMLCSSNVLAGLKYSLFAVGRYTRDGLNQWIAGQWKNQYGSGLVIARNSTEGQSVIAATSTANTYFGYGLTTTLNQDLPHFYTASLNSTPTGFATLIAGVDGSQTNYTATYGGNTTATQQPFSVGGAYEFTTPYYPILGYLNEVIAFSSNLSAAECQIVEGYLAWKWGLTASLPASHPYKAFPPSSNTQTLPNAVPSFTATTVTNAPVPLSWAAVSESFATGILGYNVYGPTGALLATLPKTTLSYSINDLGDGYHNSFPTVSVAAYNRMGVGPVASQSVTQYTGVMAFTSQTNTSAFFGTNNTSVNIANAGFGLSFSGSLSVTVAANIAQTTATITTSNFAPGSISVSFTTADSAGSISGGSTTFPFTSFAGNSISYSFTTTVNTPGIAGFLVTFA